MTMLATVFNDPEVALIHKQCVNLCQRVLDIIVNDITFLSDELRYWRNIASLSHGSRYLTAQVQKGPYHFFSMLFGFGKTCFTQRWPSMWLLAFNKTFKVELLDIDNELFRKIMLIRAIIEDRVKHLARVNKVIARLRYVFLVVDGVDRGPASVLAALSSSSPVPPNHSFPSIPPAGSLNDMSPEEEALQAFSRREVRRALDDLRLVLNHLLTVDSVINRMPRGMGPGEDDTDLIAAEHRYHRSMSAAVAECSPRLELGELMQHISGLFSQLELKLVKGRCRNIIDDTTQRPSNFRQHWLKYLLMGFGILAAGRVLKKYIRSGQLQRAFWGTLDLVLGKIREHIVEPLEDLTTNLFDTLKRRDPIVTHDELVQSHMALNRMLESYEGKIADKDNGVDLSAVVNKVSTTLKLSTEEAPVAMKPNAPSVPKDPSSSKFRLATSRQISSMERLMKDYEKELQTPIRGLLFGDLIRSVLIQMQELKVHTESAMLTMDQVLASNELTVAVSAAIPGFCVIGGVLYILKNYIMRKLFKPVQRLKGGIPTLRIALAEIIRSLHDVEDGEIDPLAPSNVEEGWYGRGAPPIMVSQSEQDLTSPLSANIGLTLSGPASTAAATSGITRQRSLSGSRAPPITIPENASKNQSSLPPPHDKFSPSMTRSVSISQEDIMKHVPSSPRLARFAIQSSPEKPFGYDDPAKKSAKKEKTHRRPSTGSNLKVDANVLIKWGKGKDEEYRRGLLIYRVISLKRLIIEFIGGGQNIVVHRRMDVGTYDRDGPLGPKDAIRIMDLLGVVEEEYNCLMRDLQDLMLPDFEINLRRKIETASRMQQTYKCFSTM